MQKYGFFLFFIFLTCHAFSQTNPKANQGTIKISKVKPDSVYIKAEINFHQFQEGNEAITQPVFFSLNKVIMPVPKVSGYTIPFNYNKFCAEKIKVTKSDLINKISDTILIQVKILDNGKAYLKDLTPLIVLGGVPAHYDKKVNAYKLDAIRWKCLNAFKHIKQWEPAYALIGVKEKFKKTIVIKPKKKKLAATGVITLVFSSVPFEEFELQ